MLGLLGSAVLGGVADTIVKNEEEKKELAKQHQELFNKLYDEYRVQDREAKKRNALLDRSAEYFMGITNGDAKMARTLAKYARDNEMKPAEVLSAYSNGLIQGMKTSSGETIKAPSSDALTQETNTALGRTGQQEALTQQTNAPAKEGDNWFMSGARDILGFSGKNEYAQEQTKKLVGADVYDKVMNQRGLEEEGVDAGYSIRSTEGQYVPLASAIKLAVDGGITEQGKAELESIAASDPSGRNLVPVAEVLKRTQNRETVLEQSRQAFTEKENAKGRAHDVNMEGVKSGYRGTEADDQLQRDLKLQADKYSRMLTQAMAEAAATKGVKNSEITAFRGLAAKEVVSRLGLGDNQKQAIQAALNDPSVQGNYTAWTTALAGVLTPEQSAVLYSTINAATAKSMAGNVGDLYNYTHAILPIVQQLGELKTSYNSLIKAGKATEAKEVAELYQATYENAVQSGVTKDFLAPELRIDKIINLVDQ